MALTQKIIRKLKSGTWYPLYNTFYEKTSIDPGEILLVSRSGLALESNILAILQELSLRNTRVFVLFWQYTKITVTQFSENSNIIT